MRRKIASIAGLVLFVVLQMNVGVALGSTGPAEDAGHTAAHGHAAEMPETHDQSTSEKLLWGVVLSCISVVLFSIGNDAYAHAKARLTGASSLWSWSGQWINQQERASLFIPERFTRAMYLTLRNSGYALKVTGHDDEGSSWGALWCTGGSTALKHPIGAWRIERWPEDLNQPALKLEFANGKSVVIAFERAK